MSRPQFSVLDQAPAPFQGTEIHTLANGLRIILKPDATVPVVALQAWARCGAIDETPDIYGISHGLEHMVFKGTPTRSAGDITRAIESKGGSINAATQLETTHYYIDIPSYGLEHALDVLTDTILHPTFPQDELERERLVILEEIHRRDDSPEATLWDEFSSEIFKGTPYGIKVIGSERTVSAMSRQDLSTYYKAHYVPEKMTMVIAGDFNKKKILRRLERLFDRLPATPPPPPPSVKVGDRREETRLVIKKPVHLSYYAIGIASLGLGAEDAIALDLLADVLGGGTSARLYQSVREDSQLALSIGCDYIPFQQKGMFAVFGESVPGKAEKAIAQITDKILNLENDPIRPAELARAKARIKSEWLHGSETPHGQANTLGSLSVLNRMELVNTYLRTIESLSPEDLMETHRRHIASQKFHVTMVEPQ